MYTINDLLKEKGNRITTIGSEASVMDAATLMNENRIGALLVCENGQLSGIFTERDLLRRVVAERQDPTQVTVGQTMTREVVTCTPEMPINEARALFRNRRIRHLPVMSDQREPAGLISIGDINAWKLDGQEVEIQYLHEYLYGVDVA